MWALHTESPVNPAVSSASPIPTDFFYSKKLWGFIFLSLGNWAVQSGLRMGLVIPKVSLPIFIHNTWIWDHPFHLCHHLSVPCRISVPFWPLCMASPLLPMCMSVASLNPWLSGLHTAQFSDGSECYLFWGLVVILSVVTQGGKAYLSIPPSWEEFHLEILNNLSLLFFFFLQYTHILCNQSCLFVSGLLLNFTKYTSLFSYFLSLHFLFLGYSLSFSWLPPTLRLRVYITFYSRTSSTLPIWFGVPCPTVITSEFSLHRSYLKRLQILITYLSYSF